MDWTELSWKILLTVTFIAVIVWGINCIVEALISLYESNVYDAQELAIRRYGERLREAHHCFEPSQHVIVLAIARDMESGTLYPDVDLIRFKHNTDIAKLKQSTS